MKLTVLLDNNTYIDRYFLGEPGLSFYIEDEGIKVLFDLGYSNAFISNAMKLSLNLLDLDFLILSHGHLDHTWGLGPLIRLFTEGLNENFQVKKPTLIAHPQALLSKSKDNLPELGSLLQVDTLSRFFNLNLSSDPVILNEKLIFLGEIERKTNFESRKPIGKTGKPGFEKNDFLIDDSALVYKSPEGLVIITGCSHSGICNIIEYAIKISEEDRVFDIIGGLHLLNPPYDQLQGTMEYMKSLNPISIHACHCTDLPSKIALSHVANIREVGVGLTLNY